MHTKSQAQAVDEGELAALPDAALNVGATYAGLRDDIARGTSSVAGFAHAVRVAQFMADASASSENGERKDGGDWPSA